MKKTITLLLVLALALGLLTACGSTEIRSYQEDAAAQADAEDIYANALKAYSPDTLVATADGSPVHWNEYAYYLANLAAQLAYPDENGVIEWNDAEGSEESLGETLRQAAEAQILQYHVIEGLAREQGVEFDAEGETFVESLIQDAITSIAGETGTEEDMVEALQSYYMDMDVLRYQGKVQYLYTKLFENNFGASGEKISDSDVAAYVEENGLMMAKHILYSFTDDEGAELDDAGKAEQKAAAEAAAQELQAITDQDARLARFDEIMNADSGDPGLAYYPDGYVFGPGEMMEAFENGTAALELYQVSDPVETSAGYHVILRLPLTGETVISTDSTGEPITLRYEVAMQQFSDMATPRMEAAEIDYEPGFENLDFNKVFAAKKSGGFFSKLFGK